MIGERRDTGAESQVSVSVLGFHQNLQIDLQIHHIETPLTIYVEAIENDPLERLIKREQFSTYCLRSFLVLVLVF